MVSPTQQAERDLEKGQGGATSSSVELPNAGDLHPISAAPGKPTQTEMLASTKSKSDLQIFQELVGIQTNPGLLDRERTDAGAFEKHVVGRPHRSIWRLLYKSEAINEGYYKRAIDEELKAAIGFEITKTIFTIMYLLQILVAATITALAAYKDHSTVVTVLGAINTVLAGLVAYVRGLGLPNRMLRSRDQFRHVKEYVEYRERQFSCPDANLKLNPWAEADTVMKLYIAAKKDQQDNYPDSYINHNETNQLAAMKAKDDANHPAPKATSTAT